MSGHGRLAKPLVVKTSTRGARVACLDDIVGTLGASLAVRNESCNYIVFAVLRPDRRMAEANIILDGSEYTVGFILFIYFFRERARDRETHREHS